MRTRETIALELEATYANHKDESRSLQHCIIGSRAYEDKVKTIATLAAKWLTLHSELSVRNEWFELMRRRAPRGTSMLESMSNLAQVAKGDERHERQRRTIIEMRLEALKMETRNKELEFQIKQLEAKNESLESEVEEAEAQLESIAEDLADATKANKEQAEKVKCYDAWAKCVACGHKDCYLRLEKPRLIGDKKQSKPPIVNEEPSKAR